MDDDSDNGNEEKKQEKHLSKMENKTKRETNKQY